MSCSLKLLLLNITPEDWEEMDNSESSSDELMGAEGGMEEDEGKDNSLYVCSYYLPL